MRRRRIVLVVAVVGALLATASPAFAEDLEDYLDMAADADYGGTRVVVTIWDGRSHAEMTNIEHSRDVMMLGVAGNEAMIVAGKVTRGEGAGVALATWSGPAVTDKYAVGQADDVTWLGRRARAVTILEDGVKRARILFDVATWAPLVTEIYSDSGELFRVASFTTFNPHPTRIYDSMPDAGHDYDLVARIDQSSLPATAGGYERVDIYAGADGVNQDFFTDGLFSFSVFEVTPRQVRQRFDGADSIRLAGGDYVVLVRPSELWVAWEHGDAAYVLVGDLPPDHLEHVLVDLPVPKGRSWLDKLLGFFS